MINPCLKWLKIFLALEIKKIGFFIVPIFSIYIEFPDEFRPVLLALLPLPTILLLLILNVLRINCLDNQVVFNIEVNNAAILLKFQIKSQ